VTLPHAGSSDPARPKSGGPFGPALSLNLLWSAKTENSPRRVLHFRLEPIREVLESAESDVIHCWAPDSLWGSA
jgi:hypothetical protein